MPCARPCCRRRSCERVVSLVASTLHVPAVTRCLGSPVGVHSCAQVKGGWGLVRNNDSKVPYGSCVYALGSDARLDCKPHGSCGHVRQVQCRRRGPAGVLISRLEQPLHASAHHGAHLRTCASCMQVLTTASHIRSHARPACKCSPRRPHQNLRALHANAHHGAPPSELARPAARVELHEMRAEAPQRRLVEIKRAEST